MGDYVLCTLMQENIEKMIPTAIYVFFLIWQIIIGLSVYYATVNLTLIQGKYLRKKKKYVSFNVTTKIIKCQLFSLNIVCSIFVFIKQVILHLKCSVSSTVTKFEHWQQSLSLHKGKNKITELRTILQRESQNS
jgi:hypothetical protein